MYGVMGVMFLVCAGVLVCVVGWVVFVCVWWGVGGGGGGGEEGG